ncbi:hypothetical protein EV401DRAFT_1896199 [Pisolithus croceorrhizus]|nr:hypothetical protein EV401DRAFT_1896199 [Pisolithus croceorrhizus]
MPAFLTQPFSLSTLLQTESTRPRFSKQSFDNRVNALHLTFATGMVVNAKVKPQHLTFSTGMVVNAKYWPNIHMPGVVPEIPSAVIIRQSSGPLMPTHCAMSSQHI